MMKECLKCKQQIPYSEFYKSELHVDGYTTVCKSCTSEGGKNYRHSLVGLIRKTYGNQITASRKRGHVPPNYTEEDFMIWMIRQDNFLKLFNDWVESGYSSPLKPSGDRLNDYKPYTFDNLRLVTWAENEQKMRDDVRNGINTKKSKACEQYTLDGEFITNYHSLRDAARATNSDSAGISACCKGKQYKHNGYIWKYSKELV